MSDNQTTEPIKPIKPTASKAPAEFVATEPVMPAEKVAAATTDAPTKAVAKKRVKKAARQVSLGRAYVKSTYNNTIITFTDQNGNVLSWSSAGQCGFKGPKKATPYAATMIVKDAFEKAKKYGLKEVSVFVRGIGGGREAAIRAMNANGLIVGAIKDVTPIPHNGCRPPRPRRI